MPDLKTPKEIEAEIPRLRRYARFLTRNATKADELTQDTLVQALVKQESLRKAPNFRAALFQILHNEHAKHLKEVNSPPVTRNASIDRPTARSKIEQPDLRDLDRALDRLPEEQRQVILLIGLEGMTYEAAGEVLSIPVGTVRSRLSRGRESLRRLMGITPSG